MLVLCPKRKVMTNIKFVVDTGSPYSFIGRDDIERNDRLLHNLVVKKRALMGGGVVDITEIPDSVILNFHDENGKICKLELPGFSVTETPSSKHKFTSPSILGLDFLKEHGFVLFVDMKNGVAYLERLDTPLPSHEIAK